VYRKGGWKKGTGLLGIGERMQKKKAKTEDFLYKCRD